MQTATRIEKEKAGTATGSVKPRQPWWKPVGETVLALAATVFLLESFFNFAGIGQQEFFEPDPLLGARHIPSKQVTWRMEGLSRDSFNSFGMRDYERTLAKPQDTVRVAVLGDSGAEGLQVPLKNTFPIVVQDMLNEEAKKRGLQKRFEVMNFGCAGYSMLQEILQYETLAAKFSPDIVVLFYNRMDATESIIDGSMRSIADPKPFCYLSPEGEVKLDTAILEARADELKPNAVLDWLRRNSRLYGVVNQTLFSLSINDKHFVKWKHMFEKGAKVRKVAPATYPAQNEDQVAAKLLERLNNDVKSKGGRLIVMMFPNLIDYPDLTRQQKLFSGMAEAQGFGYLDLSDPVKNYKRKEELLIEYHFSTKGHKLIADLLKPYLQ
ncbi:MAG: hypothetical protein IT343_07120 [Candidatus Melainabacteria bacterium]|jgi:hypothetical protein|nr:hypothetical protein [Candidatus Melainabacteria bacterium]